MKRLCCFWLLGSLLIFLFNSSKAQCTNPVANTIDAFRVPVSYYKTTNLIFPYAIKSVDRGSNDVLVQKAKGVDNILQLKAGAKEFAETNLSVVTSDGAFYSFSLLYDANTSLLNIVLANQSIQPVKLTGQTSASVLEREFWQVLGNPSFMHTGERGPFIHLMLKGIYLSESAVWMKLQMTNWSQIDFQPEYVRFFLRDKKRSKRTALQEVEMFPVCSDAFKAISGRNSKTWTIAFQPFTVPPKKRLIIQVSDQDGGRYVELKIKPKTILAARKLR